MKKGDIIRRTNMWGSAIGDYLKVISIDKEHARCKYVSCDVNALVNKKRAIVLKKCTVKISKEDHLKLKVANLGVYKHLTTAQFSRLEDELPDIIAFCAPGKSTLYYKVGMIYSVTYKCRPHTFIELIDLINK